MEAEREASALMGSGEAGDAQAASSGKAGGGGKGGEGGALRCRALASCSRRIWFWSCWIFSGSLGRPGRHPAARSRVPGPLLPDGSGAARAADSAG